MSILSGYKKVKDRILTSSGYQLLSRWTSSNTVDFDDGKTAQTKVGAINGIIKDKNSLSTVTDDSFAAGAVAVKDAIADVNSKLGNFLVTYSFLSGIGDYWVHDSQYPERYYKTYEIPEKEGYKFFFAYYEIAWTSGNVYGNYLLRNQFLYDKTGRIEVYSNTGNPNFVPEFICVYLPL